MDQDVLKIVSEINKKGFAGALSEKVLLNITATFLKLKKDKINAQNLETEVREYTKKVLIASTKKSTLLQNRLLRPYLSIYNSINSQNDKMPSEELLNEFIRITIGIVIDNYEKNYGIKGKIQDQYKKIVCSIRPQKEVPPKEKKEEPFVSRYFKEHKTYLKEILASLSRSEKEQILALKEENLAKGEEVLSLVKMGLRYYPLIKWQHPEFLERQEKLKKFYQNKKYEEDILTEQTNFLNSFPYSKDIVLLEIEKKKESDVAAYQKLQMFLGKSENTCAYELLEQQIKLFQKELAAKDLSSYTIFSSFAVSDKETVTLLFQCFKNEYPIYYEIIKKKYGERLSEFHLLKEEEELVVQEAIRKLDELLKQFKEGSIRIDALEYFIYEVEQKQELVEFLHSLKVEEKLWLSSVMQERIENNLRKKCGGTKPFILNKSLQELKEVRPSLYQTLIIVHGESLMEYNKEKVTPNYTRALTKLQKLIQIREEKYHLQREEKTYLLNTLKALTTEERRIVKEKRMGCDTYFLSRKYQKEPEELYRFFANHILLFGNLIPYIIREILLNSSNAEVLLSSDNMNFLLSRMPKKEIMSWKKELCDISNIKKNIHCINLSLQKRES